ncbi:hypothetical protein FQA39_LY01263 [Lamprigera yunnana]|nr:hypothetical protein FQA39_LY01263 [Lamprigera yunnana]
MDNEVDIDIDIDTKFPTVQDKFIEHYEVLSEEDQLFNNESEIMNIIKPLTCFKVRWYQGFKLIIKHAPNQMKSAANSAYSNYISIVDVSEELHGSSNHFLMARNFEIVYKWSLFTKDDLGFPCLYARKGHDMLLELQASSANSEFRQVWDLCTALWGPNSTNDVKKRGMLGKWLEANANTISSSSDVDELPIHLYYYLVSHKVNRVCETAMHQDFPALSVLCAQTQTTTRKLVQTQCEQWYRNGTFHCMEHFVKKVYVLLAGLTNVFDVNVLEGLNWKQILSLYLFYICPVSVTTNYVLDEYGKIIDTVLIENDFDIEYHILRFSNNSTMIPKTVLNPTSYTKHTENFFLSWFLMQTFSAVGAGKITSTLANNVHLRFAAQLESSGLWHWSIFVLLFVKDRILKYQAIKHVLEQNYYIDCSDSMKSFLLHTLQIPTKFLHSAMAIAHYKMGDHFKTFRLLTSTDDWYIANQIALNHIIPNLIFNHKYDTLSCMIVEFGKTLNRSLLKRTGMIFDFVEVYNKVSEYQRKREMHCNEYEITAKLFSLFNYMNTYPIRDLQQSLMISEVSKYVRLLSIACYNTFQTKKFKELDKVPLIMPHDFNFFHGKGVVPIYYYDADTESDVHMLIRYYLHYMTMTYDNIIITYENYWFLLSNNNAQFVKEVAELQSLPNNA